MNDVTDENGKAICGAKKHTGDSVSSQRDGEPAAESAGASSTEALVPTIR